MERFTSKYKLNEEQLNQLKQIVPEAFKDNILDFNSLYEALSDFTENDENADIEQFGLTWPGKRQAKRAAAIPPVGTLVPVPGDGVDEDTTRNIYIEGDNLEVLKILRKAYTGRIKMIYIDPPYNTGNDFIYDDNFTESVESYQKRTGQVDENGVKMTTNNRSDGRFHSKWCSMIYPRLRLARELLSEDGVIFISIDDNEVAQLRKICDEIFGEENFVGILSVENNPKGRKNSDYISVSSEYLVIFAKNKVKSYFIENVPKKASDMKEDEDGNFVHSSGKRVLVGENSFNKPVINENSEKNYSVYYRSNDKSIEIINENIATINKQLLSKGYKKYYSYMNNYLVENTYTENKFRELFEEGALEFSEDKIYEKNFNDTIRIKSQLVNKEYEAIIKGEKIKYSMELTTTGAGTYLKKLFNKNELIFSAPKNVCFLKLLISLFEKENFFVLDFFSGSATAADAVMQLNAEDGGKRQFIMVQIPEICDKDSEAAKAGFKNICEIGKERIRRAGKKVKEEAGLNADNIDTGFKVFRLAPSNYKAWENYTDNDIKQLEELFKQDSLKPGWKEDDLLTEVMLLEGFPLDSKIELLPQFTKNKVQKISSDFHDNTLYICLDKDIHNETIETLSLTDKERFICLDSAIDDQSKIRLEDKNLIKTL